MKVLKPVEPIADFVSATLVLNLMVISTAGVEALIFWLAYNSVANKFFLFLPSVWWQLQYIEVFCFFILLHTVKKILF